MSEFLKIKYEYVSHEMKKENDLTDDLATPGNS